MVNSNNQEITKFDASFRILLSISKYLSNNTLLNNKAVVYKNCSIIKKKETILYKFKKNRKRQGKRRKMQHSEQKYVLHLRVNFILP